MKSLLILAATILLLANASQRQNSGQFGFMAYDMISDMNCFKQHNFTYLNTMVYHNDSFVEDGYLNIMHAQTHGLIPNIIVAPGLKTDPSYMFYFISSYIKKQNIQGVQIYTGNLNGDSQLDNCRKLLNIIFAFSTSTFKENTMSILTDAADWYKNFGLTCGKSYNKYNLTYINLDGQANFDDWKQFSFGDWKSPTEKIYDQPIICGELVGSSYREGY